MKRIFLWSEHGNVNYSFSGPQARTLYIRINVWRHRSLVCLLTCPFPLSKICFTSVIRIPTISDNWGINPMPKDLSVCAYIYICFVSIVVIFSNLWTICTECCLNWNVWQYYIIEHLPREASCESFNLQSNSSPSLLFNNTFNCPMD